MIEGEGKAMGSTVWKMFFLIVVLAFIVGVESAAIIFHLLTHSC